MDCNEGERPSEYCKKVMPSFRCTKVPKAFWPIPFCISIAFPIPGEMARLADFPSALTCKRFISCLVFVPMILKVPSVICMNW